MLRWFSFTSIFLLGLFQPAGAQDNTALQHIVSAQWLSQQQHNPNLLIVDARLADDYVLGHVKGAVNIPYPKLFGEGRLII